MLSENGELTLIQEIEQSTGLIFREKPDTGNLCYIHNNEELRSDFKLYFTEEDFYFYMKSFTTQTPQVPKDKSEFWFLVGEGRKLSKN